MGILVNGCSIFIGGLLGCVFRRHIKLNHTAVLAISIMLLSCVGVLENVLAVSDGGVKGEHVILLVLALLIGNIIGQALRLEGRLQSVGGNKEGTAAGALVMSSVFFGIGGLQISGSILLAMEADSSQLLLKSVLDFPFALCFGAAYGMVISASCIPVMLVQLVIAMLIRLTGEVFDNAAVRQICALGYLILFLFGFNLLAGEKHKMQTTNLLPSMFLLVLYHSIRYLF